MTVFDEAIGRGASWLVGNLREEESDGTPFAGWGWIPEIPISPLNTAEVVCALSDAGEPVPKADLVAVCLERGAERCLASRDISSLHTSWLLMAFHRFPSYEPPGRLVDRLRDHLVSITVEDGTWAFTPDTSQQSVFCTALAVEALACCRPRGDTAHAALDAGVATLLRYLETDDRAIVDTAFAVRALARAETGALLGGPENKVRDRAVDWLLHKMQDGVDGIAEEQFSSAKGRQVWRHAILAPAIEAVALQRPEAIFTPPMRRSLRTLIESLQVREPERPDFGAFRTSQNGFVTTYGTTLALNALTTVAHHATVRVSPAEVFERLCETDGLDPSDPQTIVQVRGRRFIANFPLALAVAVLVSLQSAAIIAIAIADSHIAAGLSRTLVVVSLLLAFPAVVLAASARFPEFSRLRMIGVTFAVMTGAAFPILTFVVG